MKTMGEMIFSKHFQHHRAERITYINNTVGFGEEIVIEYKYETKRECITNTGVCLVMALDSNFVITAYIAQFRKVHALCKNLGMEKIPNELFTVVKGNAHHWEMQNYH